MATDKTTAATEKIAFFRLAPLPLGAPAGRTEGTQGPGRATPRGQAGPAEPHPNGEGAEGGRLLGDPGLPVHGQRSLLGVGNDR
jgi:hypothetical protein